MTTATTTTIRRYTEARDRALAAAEAAARRTDLPFLAGRMAEAVFEMVAAAEERDRARLEYWIGYSDALAKVAALTATA